MMVEGIRPVLGGLAVADQIVLAVGVVVFALLLGPVVFLFILALQRHWSQQSRLLEEAGTIHCRRCHHVGLASLKVEAYRGNLLVCARCGSEDWETVREVEVLDD
jgi:hypothetical protein